MARIIDARVRQKAATLEEWNNSDLDSLDGEQLFVRSDVDDKVIGFKLGARGKKFSELDYPDFTVRGKVSPTSSWIGRQSGVYIPTSNGVYNGVTVNLSEGYQVLYWDGNTIEKVVYPADYTSAVFGGVIDDSKDLSIPPTEPTWYIASPGDYNTTPAITLTENSILTWDGNEWSHIPFELEVRGEFLVADNIAEVRNITPEVAQLLVNGTYKGVEVLGYYEKGDTPAPIIYYLSDTTKEDDGGSVIEAGGIKLKHEFVGEVDIRYFGAKDNEYIDSQLDIAMSIAKEKNNTVIVPKTPNGYKVMVTKDVYTHIKGYNTVLNFDVNENSLFTIKSSNVSISGFNITSPIVDNPEELTYVPVFVWKRGAYDNISIHDNTIRNLRIYLASETSLPETLSRNIRIHDNDIENDYTGYPTYDIQNDIITVFNAVGVYIFRNKIKGINTNRCFKISSQLTEVGNTKLSDMINVYDNEIDMLGVDTTVADQKSKQVFDLFQNTFNVFIRRNKIKSRRYTHIIENKSYYQTDFNRLTIIEGNEIDVDSTYVFREVGSNGNTDRTSGTGKQKIIIRYNDIRVSTSLLPSPTFQTIGVHHVVFDDNDISVNGGGYALLSISNADTLVNTCNRYKNVFTRITFNNTNNIGDTYVGVTKSNFIYNYNRIKFDVNPSSFTGIIELRHENCDAENFIIKGNIFIGEDGVTTSLLPFYRTFGSIKNLKLQFNSHSFMGNVTIDGPDRESFNIIDLNNTWTSLGNTGDNERFLLTQSVTELVAKAGNIMYDYVGSANNSISLNKCLYNNRGCRYVFKNSSSYELTVTAGTDVTLNSFTLKPSESIELIAYNSNAYRISIDNRSSTTTRRGVVLQAASSSDTAVSPSGTYNQAEVQAILTELRDLKTKLRAAGILAT